MESIDDYLEFCLERGEEPDKPFGRLMLRLSAALHRKVYVTALKEGKSLNQWIRKVGKSRLTATCGKKYDPSEYDTLNPAGLAGRDCKSIL